MTVVSDRLFSKCEVSSDGCWIWQGSPTKYGYGQTWVGQRRMLVHRAMYIELVGPIPDGLTLDHLCRHRICCNPAHLEAVTNAENCRRGERAMRVNCSRCGGPLDYRDTGGGRRCSVCQRERKRAEYAHRKISTLGAETKLDPELVDAETA